MLLEWHNRNDGWGTTAAVKIKLGLLNIVICVVLFAILMGTPFCWGDALVSAGAIILGAMIIGVLLIIGSSKPSRNKE